MTVHAMLPTPPLYPPHIAAQLYHALTTFEPPGMQYNRAEGSLTSLANGSVYGVGAFSTPSVKELREQVGTPIERAGRAAVDGDSCQLRLSIVNGDVSEFHVDPANEHAVFQAASQFNCLEFVSPRVSGTD
jgi:hypothetical protein